MAIAIPAAATVVTVHPDEVGEMINEYGDNGYTLVSQSQTLETYLPANPTAPPYHKINLIFTLNVPGGDG